MDWELGVNCTLNREEVESTPETIQVYSQWTLITSIIIHQVALNIKDFDFIIDKVSTDNNLVWEWVGIAFTSVMMWLLMFL